MVGLCKVDVKPFGPVQLYVAPVIVSALIVIVDPWQTGELLFVRGAAGVGFAATYTLDIIGGQLVAPSLTATEYVPAAETDVVGVLVPLLHEYVYGGAPQEGVAVSETEPLPPEQITRFAGVIPTVIPGTTYTRIVSLLVPGHDVFGDPLTT